MEPSSWRSQGLGCYFTHLSSSSSSYMHFRLLLPTSHAWTHTCALPDYNMYTLHY